MEKLNEEQTCINADKEIWRQPTTDFGKEDGNDKGMEPSVFITKNGGVGFNHYGTCRVKTIKEWVKLMNTRPSLEEMEIDEGKILTVLDKSVKACGSFELYDMANALAEALNKGELWK